MSKEHLQKKAGWETKKVRRHMEEVVWYMGEAKRCTEKAKWYMEEVRWYMEEAKRCTEKAGWCTEETK